MAVLLTEKRARDRQTLDSGAVVIGRLVHVDSEGRPFVTFNGAAGPTEARVGTSQPCPSEEELQTRPAVVLMFEENDPDRPIVIGFVRTAFARQPTTHPLVNGVHDGSVHVNGKTLVFEGQDEIVLRCGLGSLTIRANGQVVVKGTKLVSRASETNKIRGATVQIN
jgi:Domain of unknown function (DUF6484)